MKNLESIRSLFKLCADEEDYSNFIEYFESIFKDNFNHEKIFYLLVADNPIFTENLILFFKDKGINIFNKNLLSILFEDRYEHNLSQQYFNYRTHSEKKFINENYYILDFFEPNTLKDFISNNKYILQTIYNTEFFDYIYEKKILNTEQFIYINSKLSNKLLQQEDIINQNIVKFLPTQIQEEIQKISLKDFFTLYSKPHNEIFLENKEKEKILLDNYVGEQKNGIVFGNKNENLKFIKKINNLNQKINNIPLIELMLKNDFYYIQHFFKNENLNKNKYLSTIDNINEKIKFYYLTYKDNNKINSDKYKLINSAVSQNINQDIINDILKKNLFTNYKCININNITEDDIILLHNFYNNMDLKTLNKIITSSFHTEKTLEILSKIKILEDFSKKITDEDKGKIITIKLFKKYPDFFYNFKNEEFREKNKNSCQREFEKEILVSNLLNKKNRITYE